MKKSWELNFNYDSKRSKGFALIGTIVAIAILGYNGMWGWSWIAFLAGLSIDTRYVKRDID